MTTEEFISDIKKKEKKKKKLWLPSSIYQYSINTVSTEDAWSLALQVFSLVSSVGPQANFQLR